MLSFLFVTLDNINTLAELDHLVIDGTFKSSPSLFTQLLVTVDSNKTKKINSNKQFNNGTQIMYYSELNYVTIKQYTPITWNISSSYIFIYYIVAIQSVKPSSPGSGLNVYNIIL